MYQHILYDVRDAIATITLNRPEKLNAYSPAMGGEVVAAFRAARGDDAVRVIILTGAGRGFCAGVDLEVLKASHSSAEQSGPKLGEEDFIQKLPLELRSCEKPVIAAINGHAIGVGITMTLPCDLRIAAASAKLGFTFAKLGMLPGLGSTHLLPRLIGPGRAKELVLTGRVILGPEAAEIGLVDRCVSDAQLMQEVREIASMMAACEPRVLALAKRALDEGAALDLAAAMLNEQALSAKLRGHAKLRDDG
jgi:enoyl-CoA hydratase/carnithine racemase